MAVVAVWGIGAVLRHLSQKTTVSDKISTKHVIITVIAEHERCRNILFWKWLTKESFTKMPQPLAPSSFKHITDDGVCSTLDIERPMLCCTQLQQQSHKCPEMLFIIMVVITINVFGDTY